MAKCVNLISYAVGIIVCIRHILYHKCELSAYIPILMDALTGYYYAVRMQLQ